MSSWMQTGVQKSAGPTVSRSDELAAMYHDYFPRIHSYICCRIGNFHDADDLTGQIFLKFISKFDYYQEDKAPLSVWIFSIARNTVTDYYRRHGRQTHISLDDISEPADCTDAPDDMAEAAEMRRCLRSALQLLSEREREIIALKFWGEYSNRSIAALLGLSESNVGVILYRSMRRLRHILDGQGMNLHDGKN